MQGAVKGRFRENMEASVGSVRLEKPDIKYICVIISGLLYRRYNNR